MCLRRLRPWVHTSWALDRSDWATPAARLSGLAETSCRATRYPLWRRPPGSWPGGRQRAGGAAGCIAGASLSSDTRVQLRLALHPATAGGSSGVLEFRFPPGGFDMKVLELDPAKHVRWEVVDGLEEWVGTTVDWRLRQDGDLTIVLFAHQGWSEPVEFMHHCSTKWATYLMSLKSLVETGKGAPSPRDVHIAFPD